MHQPDRTTFLVLPAYNEEESLPNLLKRLAELDAEVREHLVVYVVDDGSTDRTAAIVTAGVAGLSTRLIAHSVNRGLGQAVQSGIKQVVENAEDADVAVIMDADDTHDVGLLEPMLSRIDAGADIVIASRFVAGGDDSTASVFRRFLSRAASVVFRLVFPLSTTRDFTSGYRAYRVSLLKKASIHWGERLIEEQGFACMVELLLKLRHWSPVIEEVPMQLRYDRKLGASKLKLFRTIFQYIKLALRDRLSPAPRHLGNNG